MVTIAKISVLKIPVGQRLLAIVTAFDCRKVLFNDHNDGEYLDVTLTLNNFDFFASSS